MTDSYLYLKEDSLQSLIDEHTKALALLHQQAAQYGQLALPYYIKGEISSRNQSIKDLKQELQKRQEDNGRLFISTRPITGKDEILDLAYKQFPTVNTLLDAIYYVIKDYVEPHAYNRMWILRDIDSRYMITDAGKIWATRMGLETDSRTLRQAEILPGMRLETIYAKGLFLSGKKK